MLGMNAKIAAALVFLALNGYVYWFLGSQEVILRGRRFVFEQGRGLALYRP